LVSEKRRAINMLTNCGWWGDSACHVSVLSSSAGLFWTTTPLGFNVLYRGLFPLISKYRKGRKRGVECMSRIFFQSTSKTAHRINRIFYCWKRQINEAEEEIGTFNLFYGAAKFGCRRDVKTADSCVQTRSWDRG
jgi:hypothetical protein